MDGPVVGLGILLLYVLLGLRVFDRESEWAVIYTLGRTGKFEIRGPTTEVVYSNRSIQVAYGDRVVVWTMAGLQQLQRVSGELRDAWTDLATTLPWGTRVRRPRQLEDGSWSVQASGWDRDSVSPYPIEAEGRGVSEAAALRDLEARLWQAMRDE